MYRARVLSHWPLVLAAERGFYVQLPANTSRMQSPTQVKIVLALFDEVAPCTGTRTRICACAYVIRSRTPDYFQLCSVTNPDAEPTGNVHRPHDTRSWRESLHVAAHESQSQRIHSEVHCEIKLRSGQCGNIYTVNAFITALIHMQQYARAWALDHSLVERICVVLCAFGIPVRQTLIPNGLSIYL